MKTPVTLPLLRAMNEKTYPVNEMFYTFQGEGDHMGRAAFFIRLHGCPIRCGFCDSASTWHPKHVPANVARHTVEELVAIAEQTPASWVVITGGEPTIHDLNPLIQALQAADKSVALETCGAFDLPQRVDHITVSPKWAKLPTAEALRRASELKLIIEGPGSLAAWETALMSITGKGLDHWVRPGPAGRVNARSIWLHPEWSTVSGNASGEWNQLGPDVLQSISKAVKDKPWYRAGWQLHKNYRVDALDGRSRPAAPLGGDTARGN